LFWLRTTAFHGHAKPWPWHPCDEIVQIGWKKGVSTDYTSAIHADLIERLPEVRAVRFRQGFQLVFSSEPDISLRDDKDIPHLAIEVKAGGDPAGALERLGAAMKSFEQDRSLNPRLKTVYVVRAITPELQKRINQSKPFDHTYGLAELLAEDRTKLQFANLVLRTILRK
jgi:XcyI-like restriction endonuclease